MSRIELINASCADQTVDAVVNFAVTPKAFKELFDVYYNSLKVLVENGYHSISLSLISSGIFGGSLENPVAESTKEYETFYCDSI